MVIEVVIAVVIVVAFGLILFAVIRGLKASTTLAKAHSRSKTPMAWGLDEHGNPQPDSAKKAE